MNYDNINDIFSAGVTNMTCLLQDFIQLLPFSENTVGRMVALQCIRGGLPVKV